MSVDVRELIKFHEGFSPEVYEDSVGKLTVGWGHNLIDKPIPLSILQELFEADYEDASQAVLRITAHWQRVLDPVRHAVLVDMVFNLGEAGLRQFVRTLDAIEQGRYQDAADHMEDSLWYRQVKSRARRLVRMMRTGEWPEVLA